MVQKTVMYLLTDFKGNFNMNIYLHGKSDNGTNFWCKEVEYKRAPLWWQLRGLSFTASGYGKAIPTDLMVKFNNRWRRVYCCIFSNSGTLYIKSPAGETITVQEYQA